MFSEKCLRTSQVQTSCGNTAIKMQVRPIRPPGSDGEGRPVRPPGSGGEVPVQSHFLSEALPHLGWTVLKLHPLSKAAQYTEVLLMSDYCVLKQD